MPANKNRMSMIEHANWLEKTATELGCSVEELTAACHNLFANFLVEKTRGKKYYALDEADQLRPILSPGLDSLLGIDGQS